MPYFQPLAANPSTPVPVVCPCAGRTHGCGQEPGVRPPSDLDPSEVCALSRYEVGGVWVKDPAAEHVLNSRSGKGTVYVVNVGDRDIQVGSHFHLADVNEDLLFFTDPESATEAETVLTDPRRVRAEQIAAARALAYDRSKTPGKAPWGCRLDIAPGDSMRFSPENAPSDAIEVVPIGGRRRVPGLRKGKGPDDVALD
ncbi:urease subunit beta [Streptomyces castrisilvae]|uniref:Urease subunit beta n=1 Tax=Streptomyces castrisilvae TaxID=3033811 RepID=A0ABY9HJR9_9ACTN|nr:urease subunit beta [Streptomyces sp. Mut1]WLQ34379.1 urease subunit beta [Streptomyces sp. Mut1]